MRRINEDIRQGSFSHVYLLCGSEDYLRNQYKNKLMNALLGDGDTMNLCLYEGKETNPLAVIDMAQTMPFLSERRVLILENTGFCKSSQEALAAYMKEIPEFSYFVFVEKEIDKKTRLYKAIKSHGYVSEFAQQDEQTLCKWIAGKVKKENRNMDLATIHYFVRRIGQDMETLDKELEKLLCYTMKKGTITKADVDEITVKKLENRVFDMFGLMVSGRRQETLALYRDLLMLKEQPLGILPLLWRQFEALLQIKNLKEKGFSKRNVAEQIKMNPYRVEKIWGQCDQFSYKVLCQALEDCAQTEEAIKQGKISDEIGVELILIRYSA